MSLSWELQWILSRHHDVSERDLFDFFSISDERMDRE